MRTFKLLPVIALIFITVFSSCKKEKEVEPKIDPRDAFVGNYEMEISCGSDSEDVELSIAKDAQDGKVITLSKNDFEDIGIEVDEDVEAVVSGSGFEIKETDAIIYFEGNAIEVELSGDGTLSNGKNLSIDLEIKGKAAGSTSVDCELEGEKK